jgi:hypothetical protein
MVPVPAPFVVLISILVLDQTVLSSSSSQRNQAENRARRQRPQPIEGSVRYPGNPSLLGVVRVVIGWPPSCDSGGGYGALARQRSASDGDDARKRCDRVPCDRCRAETKDSTSPLIMIPDLIA